jgi:hypothetical protein
VYSHCSKWFHYVFHTRIDCTLIRLTLSITLSFPVSPTSFYYSTAFSSLC